ncbi:MAG: hypothetical protein MJY46_05100 [Bacteroidales bacterium]|nr:hypothetical protein [Bacteroidales bacterium]
MHKRWFLLCFALITGCTPSVFEESPEYPPIFPDYTEVTVPDGLAPLNFTMTDGRNFKVEQRSVGDTVWYKVKAWNKGDKSGVSYAAFPIYISHDPIDPYIVYRLIEPGYESWHNMGIYQRELSSFSESEIVTNKINDLGCVNCHTFPEHSPARMLFHARGKGGGTVIVDNGQAKLVNLAETGIRRQGTYPAWHPSGRYVAFSSNTTKQNFTVNHQQPIEVYDTESDIMILDTGTGQTFSCPQLITENSLETFPGWSEDGATLYYCCADTVNDIVADRGRLHYRLMSIGFNEGVFDEEPKTVFCSDSCSVSFPRVNGKYILFTSSDFGTFPIWHREADLQLLNTETGVVKEASELNSPDTESYHSWSSNGRWVVFSSRRLDGRYTRLFIAHFDGEGNFGKPFLLPQKRPSDNTLRLKSYNIPEFVGGKVGVKESEIAKLFER